MTETKTADSRPAVQATAVTAPKQAETKVNEMNEAQAKEFHEQFKVTYAAFCGLAAVAHLLVFASKPWF